MLRRPFLGIPWLNRLRGRAGGSGYPFLLVDAFRWVQRSVAGRKSSWEEILVRTVAIKYVEGINYHFVEK